MVCSDVGTLIRSTNMINTLITDIEQAMLKMLNNEQLEALHNVLNTVFENVTVISTAETEEKANNP